MRPSNAVVEKSEKPGADKPGADKSADKVEKLVEKRRALGRGLDSLLPGPRAVVTPHSALAATRPPADDSATGSAAPSDPTVVSGRLDALQAAAGTSPHPDSQIAVELNLEQIGANPYQTRTEFDPRALNDLAVSIQTQGVLQPIVVRPRAVAVSDGIKERFFLILGERRFRASKIAGKKTIPAIIKRVSDQQAAEMTLVENLQREDLDCLDQAEAFLKLSTEFKLKQEQIGERVGISREQVSNYLRLLKLPPEVKTALRKKELTYSHARLLLSLVDDLEIVKVARMVIAKKMSVALLTELVLDANTPRGEPQKKEHVERRIDPNVRAVQRELETILAVKVRIQDRKGRGKITLEYNSVDDFQRVVRMLEGH